MTDLQRRHQILLSGLFLLLAGGCSANGTAVKEPPQAAATAAALSVEAPAGRPAKPGRTLNAIVAVVNGEPITLVEVDREAEPAVREAEKKAAVDPAARSSLRKKFREQLIERKLLDQKSRELDIRVSDEEVRQAIDDVRKQNRIPSQEAMTAALAAQGLTYEQYRLQMKEQLEKLRLVSMEVRSRVQVGETEMREYFEANRGRYSEEETFTARHIFFRISDKAPADEIKRTMSTALLVLSEARGGKDFAELARSYSEDPAARKDGGLLGTFRKGDMMPELEQAIQEMKPGDVSELVHTQAGFHIIKLEERTAGRIKPFETVKGEIEETLYRKKSEERFSQWAKELRSRASIELKELPGIL